MRENFTGDIGTPEKLNETEQPSAEGLYKVLLEELNNKDKFNLDITVAESCILKDAVKQVLRQMNLIDNRAKIRSTEWKKLFKKDKLPDKFPSGANILFILETLQIFFNRAFGEDFIAFLKSLPHNINIDRRKRFGQICKQERQKREMI